MDLVCYDYKHILNLYYYYNKDSERKTDSKKILEYKILSRTSIMVLWSLLLMFLKIQKGGDIADIRYNKTFSSYITCVLRSPCWFWNVYSSSSFFSFWQSNCQIFYIIDKNFRHSSDVSLQDENMVSPIPLIRFSAMSKEN